MFDGLPSVELLREYRPKQLSQIISADNKVLYEFYDFNSNREVVDIDIIPNHLKNALIANEDRNFSTHYGIHIPSILRSFYINFIDNSPESSMLFLSKIVPIIFHKSCISLSVASEVILGI